MSTDLVPLRAWRGFALVLAAIVLLFLGCVIMAPAVPVSPLAAYVFGFACVASAAITSALCVPRLRVEIETPLPRGGLISTPGRAAILAAALALALLACARALSASGWLVLGSLGVLVALLVLGSLVGARVGVGIEHPGHLVFVAIVSSLADVFSVTQPEGPSAVLVDSPAALSLLAVPWPMLGTLGIEPFLGVGDVVFTSLYFAASRAHGLSERRTTIALACAYLVTMLIVIGIELPVPALPFLGAAMVAVHPAARRPPARDRRRGYAVVLGLLLLLLVLLARKLWQ